MATTSPQHLQSFLNPNSAFSQFSEESLAETLANLGLSTQQPQGNSQLNNQNLLSSLFQSQSNFPFQSQSNFQFGNQPFWTPREFYPNSSSYLNSFQSRWPHQNGQNFHQNGQNFPQNGQNFQGIPSNPWYPMQNSSGSGLFDRRGQQVNSSVSGQSAAAVSSLPSNGTGAAAAAILAEFAKSTAAALQSFQFNSSANRFGTQQMQQQLNYELALANLLQQLLLPSGQSPTDSLPGI